MLNPQLLQIGLSNKQSIAHGRQPVTVQTPVEKMSKLALRSACDNTRKQNAHSQLLQAGEPPENVIVHSCQLVAAQHPEE
jgi:hypothetical protein